MITPGDLVYELHQSGCGLQALVSHPVVLEGLGRVVCTPTPDTTTFLLLFACFEAGFLWMVQAGHELTVQYSPAWPESEITAVCTVPDFSYFNVVKV